MDSVVIRYTFEGFRNALTNWINFTSNALSILKAVVMLSRRKEGEAQSHEDKKTKIIIWSGDVLIHCNKIYIMSTLNLSTFMQHYQGLEEYSAH